MSLQGLDSVIWHWLCMVAGRRENEEGGNGISAPHFTGSAFTTPHQKWVRAGNSKQ